jgi:nucleotide-binding universal stress UspA family protein
MEISDSATMRRIIVGVRPEGAEPWVLKAAAELAEQTGAGLTVVSVDELETEMLSTLPRSEVTARAEHAAAEAVERLREAGVEAALEVRVGRAFEQIIGFADAWDADLIVVGTISRGRLASALLGSVPLSLVRSSRRPVLVVSAPESR